MPFDFLSPIHKAGRQIAQYLAPRMSQLGLSNTEAHVLSYLMSYGPCAIAELQAVFGHRKSTLTSLLDRLEEKDFLTRQTYPHDRRSFIVSLTETGVQRAELVRACLRELEDRIRGRLDGSTLDGFREVMAAIDEETRCQHKPMEES